MSAIAVAGDSLVSGMNEANGAQQTRSCWRVSRQRTLASYQMRNSTVRRRWHENLFTGRVASAVWAALIVPLFATIAGPPAAAHIVAPTGTTQTVPANTTITCTGCVALSVPGPAPPGTIIAPAPGPFTLDVTSAFVFTAGANTRIGSGGVITLENGTINTTSTSPVGAQGVVSQSGTITGT